MTWVQFLVSVSIALLFVLFGAIFLMDCYDDSDLDEEDMCDVDDD
jgi:hypothetical protein